MKRTLLLGIFLVLVVAIQGGLGILFLRWFTRDWWRVRWVRRSVIALPLVGIGCILIWGTGEYFRWVSLVIPMATVTSLVAILQIALVLALLVSGLVNSLNWLLEKLSPSQRVDLPEQPLHVARRAFLKRAAIVAPAVTLSLGVTGMVRSYSGVDVSLKKLTFPSLPPDLEGLRILHLCDLHLRYYVTLADLEPVLRDAEKYRPDLVLVVGDIADDLKQLPDALRMIDQLKAPLGTVASLGNHEHFRGVDRVRSIFDKAPIPLFVDQSIVVKKGNTRLLVAAIDDPVHMGEKDLSFYRTRIDATLEKADPYDFSVLMSHRPDALDHASERKIDLTLAGHTHGGQMGLFGRSVFETVWPERYLWGHYRRGNSQLYTSSGVGHWFPFRLGCPPEAPVIELHRG
jgi:hypothetical protein